MGRTSVWQQILALLRNESFPTKLGFRRMSMDPDAMIHQTLQQLLSIACFFFFSISKRFFFSQPHAILLYVILHLSMCNAPRLADRAVEGSVPQLVSAGEECPIQTT